MPYEVIAARTAAAVETSFSWDEDHIFLQSEFVGLVRMGTVISVYCGARCWSRGVAATWPCYGCWCCKCCLRVVRASEGEGPESCLPPYKQAQELTLEW